MNLILYDISALKKLSNELCSIAVDFVAENKPKIKELSSLKSYYEALWNSDPVDSSKHGVRKNEDFMLCAQTARTSLRSSLSRYDNMSHETQVTLIFLTD